jgi:hypothetical protein
MPDSRGLMSANPITFATLCQMTHLGFFGLSHPPFEGLLHARSRRNSSLEWEV